MASSKLGAPFLAVVVACVATVMAGCSGADEGSEKVSEASDALRANAIETWAFCGINPDDPNALKAAKNMARVAGIDATMGPCRPGGASYSAAFPGSRYVSPQDYLRVAWTNAVAGMKTVVYDARMWSDDPNQRQEGYDFWGSHLDWVRAWDMGDEFDPASPQWETLKHRWHIMLTSTLSATGIGPFTNHLGSAAVLERALSDRPRAGAHLSFDLYDFPAASNLAAAFHDRVAHLMRLTKEMHMLRFSGCGSILVFGGAPVVGGSAEFGASSLVDSKGNATALAYAVREGAK
jgi:hypothetical protein